MDTWEEDHQALLEQRRNYLKSLRYLEIQFSKQTRLSVDSLRQWDEVRNQIRQVEERILEIEQKHPHKIEKPIEPLVARPDAPSNETWPPIVPITSPSLKSVTNPVHIMITVGVLLFAALLLGVVLNPLVVPLLSRPDPRETQSLAPVTIYTGYYHIGDVTLSEFRSPAPQANPFIQTFEVIQIGPDPYLSLQASHVDPNVAESPVYLYINGNHIGNLNSYFTTESLPFQHVVIPIDDALLKLGINEIRIEAQSTDVEYGIPNLDDFEFGNISLMFSQDDQ